MSHGPRGECSLHSWDSLCKIHKFLAHSARVCTWLGSSGLPTWPYPICCNSALTLTLAMPSQVTVPYLRSEYGKEYDFDAPVRLLEKMMHGMADSADQQVVVLGQVLAAEVNIGYEDVSNTQVERGLG